MSQDFFRAVGTVLNVATFGLFGLIFGGLTNTSTKRPESWSPIKQPVPPRHYAYGKGRKPGVTILYESVERTTLDVLAFCHGRIGGFTQWYFHDDPVTIGGDGAAASYGDDDRYGDVIHLYSRLGLPTETAYSQIISYAPSLWSTAHRGDHTASAALICGMVSDEKMRRFYPNGEIELTAEAQWLCVYDWRDEDQDREDPSTWAYSANPIVCWVHDEWARNHHLWDHPDIGAREKAEADAIWTQRFAATIDMMTDEADACDEAVAKAGGGTVPRYQGFVWYTDDTDQKTRRDMFRRACDGWMIERGDGAFIFRCGRWIEPEASITPDMVVELEWRAGVPKSSLVNELQIRFCLPSALYEIVDTDPWTDEASITARGRKTDAVEFPETTNNSQARRLGKARFLAMNPSHSGQLVLDLDRIPDDFFEYRFRRLELPGVPTSLDDVWVEILKPEIDLMNRTVTVDVIRASAERYAWNAATEEGDGPVDEERPGTPPYLDPPVSLTAVRGEDGETVTLTAQAPSDVNATFLQFAYTTDSTDYNDNLLAGDGIAVSPSQEVTIDFAPGPGAQRFYAFMYNPDLAISSIPRGPRLVNIA